MSAAATSAAKMYHVQHFELRKLIKTDPLWKAVKEHCGPAFPTMDKLYMTLAAGNGNAALMLKRLLYWTPRAKPGADGWIYKSHSDWFEEIGLSRRQVETARKDLAEIGLEFELKSVGYNTVNHYRLKPEAFFQALARLLHTSFEALVACVQGYVQNEQAPGQKAQPAGQDAHAAGPIPPTIQESSRDSQAVNQAKTQNSKNEGKEEKAPQPQKTHREISSSGNGDANAQTASGEDHPPRVAHPPSGGHELLTLYAENVEPMKPLLQKWIGEAVSTYGPERVRAVIELAVAVGICKWAYIRAVLEDKKSPEQRRQSQPDRRYGKQKAANREAPDHLLSQDEIARRNYQKYVAGWEDYIDH